MVSRFQDNTKKNTVSSPRPPIPTTSANLVQTTLDEITDRMKMWDINDKRSVKIHRLIGEMMAVDIQPYNIVHDNGFIRLLAEILPNYSLPVRQYFSEKIIPDIYICKCYGKT
jgi:hypothetical protein